MGTWTGILQVISPNKATEAAIGVIRLNVFMVFSWCSLCNARATRDHAKNRYKKRPMFAGASKQPNSVLRACRFGSIIRAGEGGSPVVR